MYRLLLRLQVILICVYDFICPLTLGKPIRSGAFFRLEVAADDLRLAQEVA